MCGVFGAVRFGGGHVREAHLVDGMADVMRHRGPDGASVRRSGEAIVGACRLRVRDPRSAADQPFDAPDGRLWVVCNGEIYNARQIREWHWDFPYRSRSDIEPLVPLLLQEGPSGIAQLDGMFALAAWDRCRQRLILARDRAGEKPLFYCRLQDEVWFASEIQALLRHPRISRAEDRKAVDDLLTIGYVLEPKTMFAQIGKVPAGAVLIMTDWEEETVRYWPSSSPVGDVNRGGGGNDDAGAIRKLDRLLQRAVAKQLVADVPVGVFASGGVDSSLLAAMAAPALDLQPLRLYTVGFSDPSYDESRQAACLANVLGAHHVTVRARPREMRAAFDALSDTIAEPIADPAALPTHLLARRAREDVTAVLSGEGADELFGGYPTYLGHRIATAYASLPHSFHALTKALIDLWPVSRRKVSLQFLAARFSSAGVERDWLKRHVQWFGSGLPDARRLNRWLTSQRPAQQPAPEDLLTAVMQYDYRTYLRDGLLPKLDRATMLASLESRAPYLDPDVTAFAFKLPSRLKVRGLTTKWILKEVARRWLPRSIVDRRKRGLSVPLASWLTGEFRDEVKRLLDPQRIRRRGVLEPRLVRQLVAEHVSGHTDHGRTLWPIIVYERWHERWLGGG